MRGRGAAKRPRVPPDVTCFAKFPRDAREFLKLTHRHPIALVASESPHDSSPLRGKSYAFGQTDLQPSSVFTPSGQKLSLLAKLPYAVGSFHPFGAKATLLAKLTCLRRTFSRATRANPSS